MKQAQLHQTVPLRQQQQLKILDFHPPRLIALKPKSPILMVNISNNFQ